MDKKDNRQCWQVTIHLDSSGGHGHDISHFLLSQYFHQIFGAAVTGPWKMVIPSHNSIFEIFFL